MLSIFLQSLIIGYSGAIMPGSMFTYTVDKSISYGLKPGLLVSLGHAFLELILVVLIFAGVGKYLATDLANIVIGLVGGIIKKNMMPFFMSSTLLIKSYCQRLMTLKNSNSARNSFIS